MGQHTRKAARCPDDNTSQSAVHVCMQHDQHALTGAWIKQYTLQNAQTGVEQLPLAMTQLKHCQTDYYACAMMQCSWPHGPYVQYTMVLFDVHLRMLSHDVPMSMLVRYWAPYACH